MLLPLVRSVTSNPVALLVENAISHNELRDLRGQVTFIPLPVNVTSMHQPIDMGVIYVFKRMYRKMMLRELVRDIDTRAVKASCGLMRNSSRGEDNKQVIEMLLRLRLNFDESDELHCEVRVESTSEDVTKCFEV